MRALRWLVAVALMALALPQVALAHASLLESSPSFRERLSSSPRKVELFFTQAVKASPTSIEVYGSRGRLVSRAAVGGSDPRAIEARVRPLPKGAYTVRWHALSADGHVVSGVFTFGVRAPAPPPTGAYGATGPGWNDHLVRWAYFLSLALLLGGLAFRLLVVPGRPPPRYERRFYAVTGIGAVATLECGILAFVLRAEDALQVPLERLLYGDLSPIANGTRFGIAFIAMTLGYAVVAALLFLAWLTDRRAFLWVALIVGLGFASGLSLSGHSAADAGSSKWSELADWVHLAAATIWLGGLAQLALGVWPSAPALRRPAFLRFSRLAAVLVAFLVGAGVYLSVLRLPQLSDLWSEGYGRILLLKLGLVSVALSWGAAHHFLIRPRLERGAVPGRLLRSLVGESAVAIAILLLAAVLVDSKPPPEPAPGPTRAVERS
ncbi:MAG: copper resistance protein CopC [Actinomycetota bacterium]|nr:copper resistance protein CopC [Actinomycetota bacterium]